MSIPPNQLVSSIRSVFTPFLEDSTAAEVPPAPPPTIITSYSLESSHEKKIITINKMILLNRIKKLLVKLEVYFKVLIPVVKSLVIIAISYSSPNAV